MLNPTEAIKKKRVRSVNKVNCIDKLRAVFEKLINWLVISSSCDATTPDKLFNGVIINKEPKKIINMGKDKIFIEKNGRLLNLINL